MNKEGHRFIAPIFTAGSSLVVLSTGIVKIEGNFIINIGFASALSIISAIWADADHLSTLPKPIALGTAPKIKVKKYDNKEFYYVKVNEEEFKKKLRKNKNLKYDKTRLGKYLIYYDKVRHPTPDLILFMYIFKFMGLKEHRGWQSHSVALWSVIWTILFLLPTFLHFNSIVATPIQVIMLGFGLGYLSHIIADKFTTAGLNQLTDSAGKILAKIPIVGGLLQKGVTSFEFNFAKAKNKKYAYFIGVLFIFIFWAILDFNSLSSVFSFLFNIIKTLFTEIFNIFKAIMKGA